MAMVEDADVRLGALSMPPPAAPTSRSIATSESRRAPWGKPRQRREDECPHICGELRSFHLHSIHCKDVSRLYQLFRFPCHLQHHPRRRIAQVKRVCSVQQRLGDMLHGYRTRLAQMYQSKMPHPFPRHLPTHPQDTRSIRIG